MVIFVCFVSRMSVFGYADEDDEDEAEVGEKASVDVRTNDRASRLCPISFAWSFAGREREGKM